VSLEAEATHLPTGIEVSIEGLPIGSQINAGDLTIPSGATLVTDPALLILAINEAPTEAELEAEMAEAVEELGIVEEAPEAPAEGEGGEGAAASAEGENAENAQSGE
jgi:large subunit ribosomal protein L25